MRLFIAAPVPADEAFTEAARRLRESTSGIRPVPHGHWHVTLRFLGEVDDWRNVAGILHEALAGMQAVPALVRGVGAFPAAHQARVAWAAVAADGLLAVEQKVREATSHIGSPPERRRFSPHVTLARLKPAQNLGAWIAANANVTFFTGELKEVVLFQSGLTDTGPVYSRRATFNLA